MTSEDNKWAQTLVTVTPEDDATIREISHTVTLSSISDTSLALDADKIVYRRSFTHRQFVTSQESEQELVELAEGIKEESKEILKQDAQNQTYLQGTPIVHISIEYKDEASQTMYMSSPCPPLKYFRDIMTSMSESLMPSLKRSNATVTIISFHPATEEDVVMEQLSTDIMEEKLEEFIYELNIEEEAEMEIRDIMHFLLTRAFWIVDPSSQREAETADKGTQTLIKFNYHTKTLVSDRQTQTDLTCEPKKSNTTLLSDYLETKNIILKILEECLFRGIETGSVVEDIMEEIINKCADRIRYPMKEQITQTVASKLHGEKEEDVLRKLRIDIIVDPLEASVIVVPMMDNLLQAVYDTVCINAPISAKSIVDVVLRKTMTIISKLVELQKELKPKPIDKKLAQRKKKIVESMLKKETETVSTQTSLAGIFEVKRRKESKEVVCSVCRRQSMCQWCLTDQEGENAPWQDIKMLRTQDILLAYKPCYIVTKASEKEKGLQLACPSVTKVQPPPLPRVYTTKYSSKESSETINVLLQPEKKIKLQESVNEWSYIIDATLMKPCSMKESISDTSRTTTSSDQDSLGAQSTLDSQAANALQILKDTFCNQETCIASSRQSLEETFSLKESNNVCFKSICDMCFSGSNSTDKILEQETFCTQQIDKHFSKLHLSETKKHNKGKVTQISKKSRDDSFKIIPICISQSSDT